MQEFFDNINYKVIDDLRVSISKGSRLSIAAATFSIYAFQELKEQLLNIEELRFIFTEPSFMKGGNTNASNPIHHESIWKGQHTISTTQNLNTIDRMKKRER